MLEHFSSFCSTGRDTFLTDECPVNLCTISFTDSDADLVIFKEDFANRFTMPSFQRPLNQLWMIYMLENPLHTHIFGVRDGLLMKTFIGMSMCKKKLCSSKAKMCSTGLPLTAQTQPQQHPMDGGNTTMRRFARRSSQPATLPTKPKLLLGLYPTVLPKMVDFSMPESWGNTFRYTHVSKMQISKD